MSNSFVESFDALALAGKKPNNRRLPDASRAENAFAELFASITLDNSRRAPPADRNARMPPVGPTSAPKQSRTMQYALQPAIMNIPTKPTLTPRVPARPHPDSIVSPKAAPKTPLSPLNGPTQSTPDVTLYRPRAVSAPLPSLRKGTARCNGVTKAGKQCSRQVKLPITHSHLDPIPVLYCHQHKDPLLSQHGFYVQRPGSAEKFVEFSHYIPKYLQIDTQLALRVEMEKATSHADQPGFIYTFEIRDPSRPDMIQLKVGRAVNLVKRLDQWDKQCGSKVQIPRGWWPGTVEDGDGTGGSLLKGNFQPGDPGPFCHRVERLVHIELADLSLHTPYLRGWPTATSEPAPSASSTNSLKKRENRCSDCGLVHKEIFTFMRPENGRYKGNEWELIVKPVIEKWGRFVQEYYA